MRSAASIQGHPIHPMLVSFPIAFFAGALFFDLFSLATGTSTWSTVAGYLLPVGLVTGAAAAAPGLIDYLLTVPPNSSAKQRATKHLLVNGTAMLIFLVAWITRGGAGSQPGTLQVVLEAAAMGLMTIGGWLGGELVAKNQISVVNRYAGGGRWSEKTVALKPGEPTVVAAAADLEPGQMMLLHTGRKTHPRIVLARTDDGWAAFDDRCTHKGGSLAGGMLICGTVQCPWHGSQFDSASGEVQAGPAKAKIKTYTVQKKGADILLTL